MTIPINSDGSTPIDPIVPLPGTKKSGSKQFTSNKDFINAFQNSFMQSNIEAALSTLPNDSEGNGTSGKNIVEEMVKKLEKSNQEIKVIAKEDVHQTSIRQEKIKIKEKDE